MIPTKVLLKSFHKSYFEINKIGLFLLWNYLSFLESWEVILLTTQIPLQDSKCPSIIIKGEGLYGDPAPPSHQVALAKAGDVGDEGLVPGLGRSPRGRHGQPTPVFLSWKSHGQRSLASIVHRVAKSRTWLKRLHTRALLSSLICHRKLSASNSFLSPLFICTHTPFFYES